MSLSAFTHELPKNVHGACRRHFTVLQFDIIKVPCRPCRPGVVFGLFLERRARRHELALKKPCRPCRLRGAFCTCCSFFSYNRRLLVLKKACEGRYREQRVRVASEGRGDSHLRGLRHPTDVTAIILYGHFDLSIPSNDLPGGTGSETGAPVTFLM